MSENPNTMKCPRSQNGESSVKNVLFLAPEWGAITKIGGLADVVASLSVALQCKGLCVRAVLLGYRHIRMKLHRKYFSPELPFFLLEECSHEDYPDHLFYLIRHPSLETVHEPYSPSYSDSDNSLTLLQAILLGLSPFVIAQHPEISWSPDVVHCHDWLCGLFPYFYRYRGDILPGFATQKMGCLFTIHNVEYMGLFGDSVAKGFPGLLKRWGIFCSPSFCFGPQKIEDWKFRGQVNLLATGLCFAPKINTVSPTHATELLSQEHVISEILRSRREDFSGILNGVDAKGWNPSSDPYLKEHPYVARRCEVLRAKRYWKRQLSQRLQFALNPKIPLLVSICRIVVQKGLTQLFFFEDDIENSIQNSENAARHGCGPLVDALLRNRCQLIILGEGEQELELQLQMVSWQHPRNFLFLNYFHEEMAHLLTAAADFFLMPSNYEPCGLNQIYALRYGTTPIVRRTGGLADTIQHKCNGLVFQNCSPAELELVLREAFSLWRYKYRRLWAIKKMGMEQDFSWQGNLDEYIQLYRSSLEESE